MKYKSLPTFSCFFLKTLGCDGVRQCLREASVENLCSNSHSTACVFKLTEGGVPPTGKDNNVEHHEVVELPNIVVNSPSQSQLHHYCEIDETEIVLDHQDVPPVEHVVADPGDTQVKTVYEHPVNVPQPSILPPAVGLHVYLDLVADDIVLEQHDLPTTSQTGTQAAYPQALSTDGEPVLSSSFLC